MPYQVFARDVVVANGSSVSEVIPIRGLQLVGIMVSSISGSRVGLQVRFTSSDSFQSLRNPSGTVYTSVSSNSLALFPSDIMELVSLFDAIRLVTMDSSNNPTNQSSDVTIRVFLAPI
jgi:hypothetical protein